MLWSFVKVSSYFLMLCGINEVTRAGKQIFRAGFVLLIVLVLPFAAIYLLEKASSLQRVLDLSFAIFVASQFKMPRYLQNGKDS